MERLKKYENKKEGLLNYLKYSFNRREEEIFLMTILALIMMHFAFQWTTCYIINIFFS